MSHTPGPWKFAPMEGFDELHKLRGTQPEPHEGYFRSNGGDWGVSWEGGRICLVDFKGKAKRGQAYIAPDPEGMANARLIAAAPDLLFALSAIIRDLPKNREWLDPHLESMAKEAIAKAEGKL